jgi:hypothetical protein
MHQGEFAGNNDMTRRIPMAGHIGRVGIARSFTTNELSPSGQSETFNAYKDEQGRDVVVKQRFRGMGPGQRPLYDKETRFANEAEARVINDLTPQLDREHRAKVNRDKAAHGIIQTGLSEQQANRHLSQSPVPQTAPNIGPSYAPQINDMPVNTGYNVQPQAASYGYLPDSGIGLKAAQAAREQQNLPGTSERSSAVESPRRRRPPVEIDDEVPSTFLVSSGNSGVIGVPEGTPVHAVAEEEPEEDEPWPKTTRTSAPEAAAPNPVPQEQEVEKTNEGKTYTFDPLRLAPAAAPRATKKGPDTPPQGQPRAVVGGATAAGKEAPVEGSDEAENTPPVQNAWRSTLSPQSNRENRTKVIDQPDFKGGPGQVFPNSDGQ